MFYRRKVILALMQAFEGTIEKISLQKLLFLFTLKQAKPDYDFVPYHFGCYSFSANADLTAMVKHGLLMENKNSFSRTDKTNYIALLNEQDKRVLIEIKNSYGKMSSTSLMEHTYLNHTYYAINSKVAENLLTNAQYAKVTAARPRSEQTILFTIGYQGISLEEYLNRLIRNDVKLLIDVRNNPVSMKFGFSKSQIKKYCEYLGIEYLHIPEVGIQSTERKELNTQSDYDKLFVSYKTNTLSQTKEYQKKIISLLLEKKRVALTCFEADICQCHRKHLAEAITPIPDCNVELKHI